MPTLQELRKENKRLRDRMKRKRELEEIQEERERLAKENKRLKNPKKYALFKIVKKTGARTGRGFAKMGRGAAKANKKRKSEGKSHIGLNPDFWR